MIGAVHTLKRRGSRCHGPAMAISLRRGRRRSHVNSSSNAEGITSSLPTPSTADVHGAA